MKYTAWLPEKHEDIADTVINNKEMDILSREELIFLASKKAKEVACTLCLIKEICHSVCSSFLEEANKEFNLLKEPQIKKLKDVHINDEEDYS